MFISLTVSFVTAKINKNDITDSLSKTYIQEIISFAQRYTTLFKMLVFENCFWNYLEFEIFCVSSESNIFPTFQHLFIQILVLI